MRRGSVSQRYHRVRRAGGHEPLAASWHPERDSGDPQRAGDHTSTQRGDAAGGSDYSGDSDYSDYLDADDVRSDEGAGARPWSDDTGASRFGASRVVRERQPGVLSRYGWRVYAVPLLVVLTALVVFEVGKPPRGTGIATPSRDQTADVPDGPVASEAPPGQVFSPKIFAADLPDGAPIPDTGAGTFDVIPGTSNSVGQGRLYRYTVEIETGVRLVEGNDTFAPLVQQTLADPRSWTNPQSGGIALQRVDAGGPRPDFRVTLISQNTARQVCGYGNGLPFDTSCRVGDRVYINGARWVRGAVAFNGDIGTYRRYAINHEVGHVFGNGHVPCPQAGALAPVMMQQTFSVANNDLNQLNNVVSQGGQIPADGLVCRPNAWPFPVGNQGS